MRVPVRTTALSTGIGAVHSPVVAARTTLGLFSVSANRAFILELCRA